MWNDYLLKHIASFSRYRLFPLSEQVYPKNEGNSCFKGTNINLEFPSEIQVKIEVSI